MLGYEGNLLMASACLFSESMHQSKVFNPIFNFG